jgi:hypothetical protein
MLPGFLTDPPGLNTLDDDPSADNAQPSANAPSGVTVDIGDDNPYFYPRRSGDPGGVGYYHVHSQMQLVDSDGTSVCFGMRAWAPAGLENGGVQQGRTVVAPGLAVFQDLGDGTALHGFIDQNLSGTSRPGPFRCGMAWNCPLETWENPEDRSVFFFVQAVETYGYVYDTKGRTRNCEVVPGVHWRMNDNFWMSVGASRSSMLTCGWHF